MTKFFLTLFSLVLLTATSIAQDTVYFQRQSKNGYTKKQKRSSEQNIIKLSPLSILNGFIPVYYERELNSTFAIQAGIGVTSRNYLKEWTNKAQEDNGDLQTTKWSDGTVDDYTDYSDYYNYKQRKSALGYFVAVEPRVYFENEGLEGSFIGLSLSRANYKFNANKITTGVAVTTSDPKFTTGTFAEFENITDVLVTYGYQTLYDKVAIEYNLGLGLRKLKGERYAYGQDNSNKWIDGVSTIDKTKLGFNFSIKLGYHF
jgi:hypothetical protein